MTSTGDEHNGWDEIAGRPDPRIDREIPVSSLGGWWAVPGAQVNRQNFTDTDLEALMSTAPGYEPDDRVSHETDPYQGLDLDDFEIQVLDAVVIAGLSYRAAARILGVSHTTVMRVHKSAIKRIKRQIGERNV